MDQGRGVDILCTMEQLTGHMQPKEDYVSLLVVLSGHETGYKMLDLKETDTGAVSQISHQMAPNSASCQ